MPFSIERNDLAHMNVDAVVVTANENLKITGGVGLAVAKAAGLSPVQQACDAIGFCPTGSAVATPGFALSAKTIVHAVGPVWHDGDLKRVKLSRRKPCLLQICEIVLVEDNLVRHVLARDSSIICNLDIIRHTYRRRKTFYWNRKERTSPFVELIVSQSQAYCIEVFIFVHDIQ